MSDTLRFILNGQKRELSGVDPTMTVLQYLRTKENLTGTKEGCAEGDCGACTIIMGEVVSNKKMRYRAVNSCILLLGRIDGKYILTVEGVKNPDGTLHPIQQEIVDMHGTQCGFCSPGFVMSLFALYHFDGEKPATDEDILDIMAGNLCRCTGYRPILDVARKIACQKKDRFAKDEAKIVEEVKAIRRAAPFAYKHEETQYFAPRTVTGLIDLKEEYPAARLMAGGTDLGLEVSKEYKNLGVVIGLDYVPELNILEETPEGLRIGGAVVYADLIPVFEKLYPAFGKLLRRLGSNQIRTVGTIGGNICNASPIGDSMPSLMSLGATIKLRSKDGIRDMAVEDFYTGYRKTALKPNEFLESVFIPKLPKNHLFKVHKLARRRDLDVSSVCGAFNINLENNVVSFVRIGYGGGGAVPQRALNAEQALIGKPWNEETIENAMEAMVQDFIKRRPKGDYRSDIATHLLRRVYTESLSPTTDLEVWKL